MAEPTINAKAKGGTGGATFSPKLNPRPDYGPAVPVLKAALARYFCTCTLMHVCVYIHAHRHACAYVNVHVYLCSANVCFAHLCKSMRVHNVCAHITSVCWGEGAHCVCVFHFFIFLPFFLLPMTFLPLSSFPPSFLPSSPHLFSSCSFPLLPSFLPPSVLPPSTQAHSCSLDMRGAVETS